MGRAEVGTPAVDNTQPPGAPPCRLAGSRSGTHGRARASGTLPFHQPPPTAFRQPNLYLDVVPGNPVQHEESGAAHSLDTQGEPTGPRSTTAPNRHRPLSLPRRGGSETRPWVVPGTPGTQATLHRLPRLRRGPPTFDIPRTSVLLSISSRATRNVHASHSDRYATGTNFGRHRGVSSSPRS